MRPTQAQDKAFDAIIPYVNSANIGYGATMKDGNYIIKRRKNSRSYFINIRPDGTVFYTAFKNDVKTAEREFGTDGAHCARYFLEPDDAGSK